MGCASCPKRATVAGGFAGAAASAAAGVATGARGALLEARRGRMWPYVAAAAAAAAASISATAATLDFFALQFN